MMRRVSSRQRIVSWDAFEATFLDDVLGWGMGMDDLVSEGGCEPSHDMPTCSDTGIADEDTCDEVIDGTTLKRKRLVGTTSDAGPLGVCRDTPHLVHDDESDSAWTTLLPLEVQLNVIQFMDVKSLLSLGAANQSLRHLLVSNESLEAIWKPALVRSWPWLQSLFSNPSKTGADATGTPVFDALQTGSFGMLLSMAAQHTPRHVDATLFVPQRWSRSLRTYRPRRGPEASRAELRVLNDGPSNANSTTVQFVGPVGVGDRCIRANAPLPRPQLLKAEQQPLPLNGPAAILQRLRNSSPMCGGQKQAFQPFCAPFVDFAGRINLTPRLVSYFEVSILPKPTVTDGTTDPTTAPVRGARRWPDRDGATTAAAPECVAVGLATSHFCLHSRMPGWDIHSYGYHGDDGGIFHAAGSMLKEYGSHFGVGDTVGCGVDYQRCAIFYTLNGSFLGYAFELPGTPLSSLLGATPQNSFLHQDLYPVVGLDTNSPVSCNFGTERPFQFDLAGMMAQQESAVRQAIHRAP